MKVDKLTLLLAAEFVDKETIDESTVRAAVEKAQRFRELAGKSAKKQKASKKEAKKTKPNKKTKKSKKQKAGPAEAA